MKKVVLGKWIESFPVKQRSQIVRMVFSLATEENWTILVEGQHWNVS